MAKTVTDPEGTLFAHPHPPRTWSREAEYTTQQTDAILKTAPVAKGQALYITDITIVCNAAVTVTLEEGTTVLKFKYYAAAQGDGVARTYRVAKELNPNQPLTVTTSAAVTVFVEVHGYTAAG